MYRSKTKSNFTYPRGKNYFQGQDLKKLDNVFRGDQILLFWIVGNTSRSGLFRDGLSG